MNYIKLINGFWQVRRERADFDPYVIALFFALVDIANRREWKTFTAYREDILTLSGMSTKPYYKAREILKEAKLLDYKEGSSKITKCSFTILQPLPTATQATTDGQQYGNSSDYSTETVATTILNKPINLLNLKLLNKSYLFFLNQRHKKVFKIRKKDKVKLPENLKKAAHTRAAKPKAVEHYFSESQFYEWPKFLGWFNARNYPLNRYPTIDLEYYYQQVRRWAESGINPPKRKDWIGVAHTFMNNDANAGKLKLKTPKLTFNQEDDAYTVKRFVA